MSVEDQTKSYLNTNKFYPSKKMGQNFLVNEDVLDLIQASIDPKKYDCLIEIGPGLGTLTDRLITFNKPLYLIELDKRLYANLKQKYKDRKTLTLINDDILQFDLHQITKQYKNPCIITNLPYSISSPMIIKFLQHPEITTMFCMLQQEVGERLNAKPKTSTYNAFSCIFQHYGKAKVLFEVPSNCFEPQPKVNSVFMRLDKTNKEVYDIKYSKYLKKVFAAKRKTFNNNLKNYYSQEIVNQTLTKFKISKIKRSEEISEQKHHQIYLFLKDR